MIAKGQSIHWYPLLLTMMTQAMATMAAYSLSTAAPAIAIDFAVESEDIAQLVSVVYLVGILSALIVPPFVKRFGGITVSMGIVLVTSLMLLTIANSYRFEGLILGAAILGLLYGATAPSSSYVLTRITHPSQRNFVFSIRQIGVPLGGIMGGFLIPPLLLFGDWRLVFWVEMVVVLSLFLGLAMIRRHYDKDLVKGEALIGLGPLFRMLTILLTQRSIQPLLFACFVFSGIQLCFAAFTVTHIVRVFGPEMFVFASAVALVCFQVGGIVARFVLGILADKFFTAHQILIVLGLLMALAGVVAAHIQADWPLFFVAANATLAGISASGYTGLAFAEMARLGGANQTAEITGLGAAIMFLGVAIVTPIFRWGVELTQGYYASYLGVTAIALVAVALLVICRDDENS